MGVALARRAATEALGSFFLLATIVGSGIMAERLAGGNEAIALLANTLATGAILVVLITMFAPLSGAHFNPSVSLVAAWQGELPPREALLYVACQVAGAVIGVWIAHLMFDIPVAQISAKVRFGTGHWISEFVASFGLLLTIRLCMARAPGAVAAAVGLYIGAAYWFTASTSFANPAVTIARSLSDTFAGIAPGGVIPFIVVQVAGAMAAALCARWLIAAPRRTVRRRR